MRVEKITSLYTPNYKPENKNNQGFSELLASLNEEKSVIPKEDFSYLNIGVMSRSDMNGAVEKLIQRMDFIILAFKNEGKDELANALEYIKEVSVQGSLKGYNLSISMLENNTDKIKSLDEKLMSDGLKEFNNILSTSNMLIGGIGNATEDFFKLAGIFDDEIAKNIDIIKKFQYDSRIQIELNNGTIISLQTMDKLKNEISLKYNEVVQSKKNSMLEDLLQVI